MIIPKLVNDDIIIEGEMQVGEKINGLCCAGFDWEVSAIFDSVWGNCANPDCPAYNADLGKENDPYGGVSHKDIYDIADWMIDHPCDHKTATVISGTESVCTWGCGQTVQLGQTFPFKPA